MLRVSLAVGMLSLLLLPDAAQGTVLRSLSLEELTEQALVVARGRAGGQAVVAVDGRPFTDTLFAITETIKGTARRGARLIVRQPGGTLGGLTLKVAGTASLNPGEEAVLFLRRAGDRYFPVGMAQGKLAVYRDGQGVPHLRRDLQGATLAAFDEQGHMSLQTAAPADLTLEALRRAVRSRRGTR